MRMNNGFVAIKLPSMENSLLAMSAHFLNRELDIANKEYTLIKFREMYFDGTRQMQNPDVLNSVNAYKVAYNDYKPKNPIEMSAEGASPSDMEEAKKIFSIYFAAFGFIMLGNITDLNDLFTRLFAIISLGDLTLDQAYMVYLWALVFVNNFARLNDTHLPPGYRLN